MSSVLRLLRAIVVVAAGVGAWFGYDAFVAAQETNDPSELSADPAGGPLAGARAPWADLGLIVAETAWEGPTSTTLQRAGETERHAMTVDPASGRIQISLFDAQGAPSGLAELDSNEAFVEGVDGTWATPTLDGAVSEQVLRATVAAAAPPVLGDLVPDVAWPWTEVIADRVGGSATAPTRVLTILVYGGAFANEEPALAAQWRTTSPVGRRGRVEIEVELDQQGRVVGLRTLPPDADVQYRFAPATVVPTFQAPFVD
jgi:hypothetical protein